MMNQGYRRVMNPIMLVIIVMLGMSGLLGTVSAMEASSATMELLMLFPVEAGFTGWYRDGSGLGYRLTLTQVEHRPEQDQTVLYMNGDPGDEPRREELFHLQYIIRNNEVLQLLEVPTDVRPVCILQYPLDPGRSWEQKLSHPSQPLVMTATVLSNTVDRNDGLRMVTVRYQLVNRDNGRIISTEQRLFKQGMGMVRMERQTGNEWTPVSTLEKTSPAYCVVSADRGKTCQINMDSLRFITEPNGQQVADVWVRCDLDAAARDRLIDNRYAEGEMIDGFDKLAFYRQRIWFNLADPDYRDRSRLPLRMIVQTIYYDAYGKIIHQTDSLADWHGGKWFTLPGFEEVVQKVLAVKNSGR